MARRFTLSEAERLLPDVDRSIRRAIELKSEYEEAEGMLNALARRVTIAGGSLVNRGFVIERKTTRDRSAEGLRSAIERIQEIGCLIKDLDVGLVDFPTLFRGEEVYLCWKLGETGIGFWHGTQEGFSGRKAIDREFLENHRGDPPN
ncbi:MAG: DUF2203 domain-containing protein [Bryobacteraceae bacterium]